MKARIVMRTTKNHSTIFDDDFEVTYEDDPSVFTDIQHTDVPKRKYFEDVDYEDEDDYKHRAGYRNYDDTCYDLPNEKEYKKRKKRRKSSVPLAAPIRKGGKALSRFSSTVIRRLSLLLILATTFYVTYNFWRGSALYGDIIEACRTMQVTPVLAAYFSVAALFLLFELISLFWAMTRTKVRDGFSSWKEDTGRGMFSFIAVFVSSYLAFLLNRFIPDSLEVLYGLKGALDVYGSLYNVLFGLCTAGVISCLIRKHRH